MGARTRVMVAVLAGLLGACRPDGPAPAADADAPAARPAMTDGHLLHPGSGTDLSLYGAVWGRVDGDTLVGIEADGFTVSLHRMSGDGGMMTMVPVERLPVPVGGPLELRPGRVHGMVHDRDRVLTPGDTLTAVLRFASGEHVEARLPVLAVGEVVEGTDTSASHRHH